MEYALIWILCAIFSAVIASSKNRSVFGWSVAGLLFGPFGLVVAFLPSFDRAAVVNSLLKDVEYYAKQGKELQSIASLLLLKQDEVQQACLRLLKEKRITEDDCRKVVGAAVLGKKCPFCAEYINEEAIVCRFCGQDLGSGTNSIIQANIPDEIRQAVLAMKDPFRYEEQMQLAKKFNKSSIEIHSIAVELKGHPLKTSNS